MSDSSGRDSLSRRELLVGAGGLATVAVGAGAVYRGWGRSFETIDAVDIPRIEAPGSPPGVEIVPERGRVSVVELFATWCDVCERYMEPLRETADQVGDDVQFVSVTNEPVGRTIPPERVSEWWAYHGGAWPVGYDEDLALTRALEGTAIPYTVVLDEWNRVTWADRGYKTSQELLARINEAR